MNTELLKPSLYAADGDDGAVLLGGRCAACDHVFFPLQWYGCERCGAHGDALQAHSLGATGRLLAATTVHLHADPRRAAPFTIGTVALDSGPIVRTLLSAPVEGRDVPVRAVLVSVPGAADAPPRRDLRFAPLRPEVRS